MMDWFNYYGLFIIAAIMIPNILCVIFDKNAFINNFHNIVLETIEQIGRYGCFVLMIFNIPFTFLGFWFENALVVYLITNGILLFLYLLGWWVFRKKQNATKQLWLSIIPTVLFLFSGIMVVSVPLIIVSILFGIGHITISYKNSLQDETIGIIHYGK